VAPGFLRSLKRWLTLEAMLIAGFGATAAGLAILIGVVASWSAHSLEPIANVLPAVMGTSAIAIGVQNILGGFLLAIVSGNEAAFLKLPFSDSSPSHQSISEQPADRIASGLPVAELAVPSANRVERAS
jgi:hypothetical protein